ncbi:MAG: hypothetical protein GY710_17470, partial [Desulfobacteraceae bacterium]|nr:hypothetical protein [Desulfobacteraceae bacterium]
RRGVKVSDDRMPATYDETMASVAEAVERGEAAVRVVSDAPRPRDVGEILAEWVGRHEGTSRDGEFERLPEDRWEELEGAGSEGVLPESYHRAVERGAAAVGRARGGVERAGMSDESRAARDRGEAAGEEAREKARRGVKVSDDRMPATYDETMASVAEAVERGEAAVRVVSDAPRPRDV